jgi:hypothetical protein
MLLPMRKLKTLRLVTTLVSVILAVVFFSYAASDDFLFQKNHDLIHPVSYVKIQNGMTLDEVEAVLGKERTHGSLYGHVGPTTWWGRKYIIHVELDGSGLVTNKTIEMHRYLKPTLADDYYRLRYAL